MYRMKDVFGRIIYATEDERIMIEFCNNNLECVEDCPYNKQCDSFERAYGTVPYTFQET